MKSGKNCIVNVNDRCLFFLSKNKGGLKIEQKCNRNYTREERTVPGSEISASRSEQRAPNQYINKNINNSFNNINLSITANEIDAMTNRIKENIDYDILCERYSGDMLDELVSVMAETICGNSKTVRIAGNDFAREVVKSQLLKINSEHIEYVLDCINKNTTKIKNIKAYMLTCIYNAPQTISSFYTAEVNHDLYGCG